ncbi:hypothetical protein [Priestia megaterium]|uniref:hypothetical protein n=1 Tax=Priestia megaterium TaxID=1404 RepID=UPI001BE4E5F9|nr:hypothetical protein [Priestia megaterium]MBT2254685.1 hypothetical protein [Priestia megaterium]MBT2278661.1 hypothetical protein [Priestia megaterium]MED4027892.1 hypothetical protein [Priestia megaterium]
MNKDNTVTMFSEEFENESNGSKVQGVTIIVDGKLQEVLDIIQSKDSQYSNYTEIIRDALFEGINNITKKLNK